MAPATIRPERCMKGTSTASPAARVKAADRVADSSKGVSQGAFMKTALVSMSRVSGVITPDFTSSGILSAVRSPTQALISRRASSGRAAKSTIPAAAPYFASSRPVKPASSC